MNLDYIPNIARATLEMAYDNGCINRLRPEDELLADLATWIGTRTEPLADVEADLSTLDADSFDVLCAGEDQDQREVLAALPHGAAVDSLLVAIFEDVL